MNHSTIFHADAISAAAWSLYTIRTTNEIHRLSYRVRLWGSRCRLSRGLSANTNTARHSRYHRILMIAVIFTEAKSTPVPSRTYAAPTLRESRRVLRRPHAVHPPTLHRPLNSEPSTTTPRTHNQRSNHDGHRQPPPPPRHHEYVSSTTNHRWNDATPPRSTVPPSPRFVAHAVRQRGVTRRADDDSIGYDVTSGTRGAGSKDIDAPPRQAAQSAGAWKRCDFPVDDHHRTATVNEHYTSSGVENMKDCARAAHAAGGGA